MQALKRNSFRKMKETDTTVIPKLPLNRSQKVVRAIKWTLIGSLVFVLCWRQYRVWRIPDVEPFDREAFLARYDRGGNDFHIFREASHLYHAAFTNEFDEAEQDFLGEWEEAKPVTREFLEAMRPALEHWLSGSDAEVSFELHPEDCDESTLIPIAAEMRLFVWLVRIENARLISAGDFDQALENYLKTVRVLSLHAGDGVTYYLISTHCYDLLRLQLESILAGKELQAGELKTFHDELALSGNRLSQLSGALQYNYFFSDQYVASNLVSETIPNFVTNEPELARRTVKQAYHNLLADCETPAGERPAVVRKEFRSAWRDLNTFLRRHGYWSFNNRKASLTIEYFQPATEDDVVQAGFGSLLYASEIVEQSLPPVNQLVRNRDSLRRQLQLDLIQIALHGYYREHGQFPDSLETLVPEWLDEVPLDANGRAYLFESDSNSCRLKLQNGSSELEVIAPD